MIRGSGQGKSHREKKNPHAAEQFKDGRHETNSIRPKQVWDAEKKAWVRP